MIANCAVRQAFNVQDPATARLLADMLGQSTIRITNEGKSSPMPLPWMPSSFSASTMEAGRALLTPDEVMALPGDQQLLFIQGVRPVLARKVRYFQDQSRISSLSIQPLAIPDYSRIFFSNQPITGAL